MSTRTTNYGLYKPEPTDDFGDFLSEFNNNMDEIDENLGGGGVGGTGGNVYGAFINTNDIIASGTYTGSFSYTATKDCYFYGEIANNSNTTAIMTVDGKTIIQNYDSSISQNGCVVPLRKGQTIALTTTFAQAVTTYTVYGLIQGTESIFTPIIYSDTERMIGIWRDNKPLYQRSYAFTVNLSSGQTATIATLTDYENIISLDGWINESNIFYNLNDYSARIKVNASGQLQFTSASGSSWSGSGYITVQYTKASDVAGSGDWNTDGVPTVHYSTSEQVIGTWIDGKPLYQITADFGAEITVNSNTWTNTTIPITDKKAIISAVGTNGSGTCWNFISANCDSGSYVQVYHTRSTAITLRTMTIQYTKTTD